MTDLPHLASRLYGTPLLIARPKLEVILGVIARKLAGDTLATLPPAQADVAMPATAVQMLDGIAVIPLLGTLVRRSSYLNAASGLTSYHAIEAMAEAAFADPQVRAVLLEIDSSGGEAGGVFDLAERLRALARASGKPLWAIADEAALSAAYAIASAADRIWLTRTAEVGSIGVVAVHIDESGADAQAGLHYTFLHAGAHKVDGHSHAPLPASVAADIQADIDQLYEQFIDLVARFRGLSAQDIRRTEARVYRGEAAIQAGLADQIGTRAEALAALQRRLAMSTSRAPSRSPSRSQPPPKEPSMHEHTQVAPDDAAQDSVVRSSTSPIATPQAPLLDEAAIAAQVEQRLRRQLAELTEIAAQAKRLGVDVDPAQALAQGITPDALRQSVLKTAAERDLAHDIVVAASQSRSPSSSVADSPLVKAAQAYGAHQ